MSTGDERRTVDREWLNELSEGTTAHGAQTRAPSSASVTTLAPRRGTSGADEPVAPAATATSSLIAELASLREDIAAMRAQVQATAEQPGAGMLAAHAIVELQAEVARLGEAVVASAQARAADREQLDRAVADVVGRLQEQSDSVHRALREVAADIRGLRTSLFGG